MRLPAVPLPLTCLLSVNAAAQVAEEIPLGIEAVTGVRSSYVFRGIELAQASLDFQFEARVTLSEIDSLNIGAYHLAESDGDFSETAGYFEWSREHSERLSWGASATYRDRNESLLDSGLDLGLFTTFRINADWSWRNEINYDFGAEGFYYNTEIQWSTPLSDEAFLAVDTGLGFASSYADRDGINELHTRISLTYAISKQVAVSPFIGASIVLAHEGEDEAFGGFWFQVIF